MKKWIAALLLLLMIPGALAESGAWEDVRSVEIELRDRIVEILPAEDGQVHIEWQETEKEGLNIAAEDGVLTATIRNDKAWWDFFGFQTSEEQQLVRVYLPEGIEGLTVSTTNEDVTLGTISVGSADLSVVSGNLDFESLSVGNSLRLSAKNGNIEGAVAGGWDDFAIETNVKKGRCNLPEKKEGGAKTLEVTLNNGNAQIDFIGE